MCIMVAALSMWNALHVTEETLNGASFPVIGLAGRCHCPGKQFDSAANVR